MIVNFSFPAEIADIDPQDLVDMLTEGDTPVVDASATTSQVDVQIDSSWWDALVGTSCTPENVADFLDYNIRSVRKGF